MSYTFDILNSFIEKACVKGGYVFEFWIFDKKGNKVAQY